MTEPRKQEWRNWADSASCTPHEIAHPHSTAEVAKLVSGAADRGLRVKAIGSGHSFSPIATTEGVLLQMHDLDELIAVDLQTNRVTVGAGMSLATLNTHLHRHGLALPNLGDIDRQTVSGAISTGTHGTGARLNGLAKTVVGIEVVHADGTVAHIDESERDLFDAFRVGLGALGVVTALTLQCVPAFLLHAYESPLPLSEVLRDLDALIAANDHFEFYWFPHTEQTLTKRNNRVRPDVDRKPVSRVRGFIDDELLSNTTFEVVNLLGTRRRTWVPRLNRFSSRALSAREYVDHSHRVFCSNRRVRFREMEYAVPRAELATVLTAVKDWIDRHDEVISFPIEIRFAAADDIWLSTAYERDVAYLAVHQYHRTDPTAYFAGIEQLLVAAGGRPHWGKMHTLTAADLAPRYARFGDFVALRDKLDPDGLFTNDHLDRVLGPVGG